MQEIQPDEIYNLAAQSHVKVSFETAEYTANADALGTLRLLEAMRILKLEEKTRFYQASTSELFGKVKLPALPRGASSHLLRNPPKQIRLRQGYGGYPFRIHPRPSGRGFMRRRVKEV
jgi:GDP-mannose 4,6-dehydratase